MEMVADRDVWRVNLEPLPRNPYGYEWFSKVRHDVSRGEMS